MALLTTYANLILAMTPYLLGVLFLCAVALLWGQALLHSLSIVCMRVSEWVFLSVSAGMALVILMLFVLGIVRQLNQTSVLLVGSVGTAFAALLTRRRGALWSNLKRMSSTTSAAQWGVPAAVLLCAIMIPFLPLPLFPALGSDAVSYHLPYARWFVEHEAIETNKLLRYPFFSLNYNLLYACGLMFGNEVLCQYLHTVAAFMTALGVYSLGSRLMNRPVGVLSAGVYLYAPIIRYLMPIAYIDLGFAWFVFASIYAILVNVKEDQPGLMVLGALFAGTAAGCKYSGLAYLCGFVAWTALETKSWRKTARFLLVAGLVGSPWYLRSAILAANPISPFGGRWFGTSWPWSTADLAGQLKELSKYGVPKTWTNFLQAPRLLWLHWEQFAERPFPAYYAVACYLAPVLAALRGIPRRIGLVLIVSMVAWFQGHQLHRYLVPVFPLLSLVPGLAAGWCVAFLSRLWCRKKARDGVGPNARVCRRLAVPASGGAALVFLVLVAPGTWTTDVPLDASARLRVAESRLKPVRAARALERMEGDSVYQLGCAPIRFYSTKTVYGDWFGEARYADVFAVRKRPEELLKMLHGWNCSHLVMRRAAPFDLTPFLPPTFERVYEDEDTVVCRVPGEMAVDRVALPSQPEGADCE